MVKPIIGDVLLFYPKDQDFIGHLIAFFSNNGKYCHSARYIGNSEIIESNNTENSQGVKTRYLTDADKFDCFYYPYLMYKEIYKLIIWELSKLNSDYDKLSLISSFSHSVLGSIFDNKEYQNQKPTLDDPNKYFCSELQATAYKEVLNIDICYNIHYKSVTPNDLAYKSKLIKRK